MKKNLLKKEYLKKIELIQYYNQKYYNENISEISDSKFDLLKKEILELEKKHIFLNSKDSLQTQLDINLLRILKKLLTEYQCYL